MEKPVFEFRLVFQIRCPYFLKSVLQVLRGKRERFNTLSYTSNLAKEKNYSPGFLSAPS